MRFPLCMRKFIYTLWKYYTHPPLFLKLMSSQKHSPLPLAPNAFLREDSPIIGAKVAIICDWLKDWGGAEQVLSDILEIFPEADLYTSIFEEKNMGDILSRIPRERIFTSFMQKIPFVRSRPKMFPFLRPYAFESFDLSQYDLVISSSSAESKGVLTRPETLHVSYCNSVTRYYWSHFHEYLQNPEFGWLNPVARLFMSTKIHKLRLWDRLAAERVDRFIANSETTRLRIAKYYRSDSTVITPGVDTDIFKMETEKEDFYLAVGRIVPYKRFDLLVEAFNENGKPLKIITNTQNPLFKSLVKKSKSNIEWLLDVTLDEKSEFYAKAKALVFPQEEDFGLVPIEAMLSGTPVIAYHKGGALETLRE